MLFKILDSAQGEATGFAHQVRTQGRKNNWLQQKKKSAGGNSFWRDSHTGASRQVDNKWTWHIFPQVWPLDKQQLWGHYSSLTGKIRGSFQRRGVPVVRRGCFAFTSLTSSWRSPLSLNLFLVLNYLEQISNFSAGVSVNNGGKKY